MHLEGVRIMGRLDVYTAGNCCVMNDRMIKVCTTFLVNV